MRIVFLVVATGLLACCDNSRVYEKNHDLANRYWLVQETPTFDFIVVDNQPFTLYCNLRNSVDYPYSRIFINFEIKDSAGLVVKKEMINTFLFDEKTGTPLGRSGLGDIYDQQLLLLKDFSFKQKGTYTVKFEQNMRTDTLHGILTVGLFVESPVKK